MTLASIFNVVFIFLPPFYSPYILLQSTVKSEYDYPKKTHELAISGALSMHYSITWIRVHVPPFFVEAVSVLVVLVGIVAVLCPFYNGITCSRIGLSYTLAFTIDKNQINI